MRRKPQERCVLRTRIGTINGLERFGSGGLAANQGKYHPKPSQSLPGATMELLSFQKSGVIWVISVNIRDAVGVKR